MSSTTIHIGDALDVLRGIETSSVHCCVTSPPYWGLRDYGAAGQLGLEPTLAEYLDALLAIAEQVKRVLRPDGSLWLNLGDSYVGNAGGAQGLSGQAADRAASVQGARERSWPRGGEGLKPKDLAGVPWTVAFAIRDQLRMWLREDIVWHKPTPMPETVRDRCTRAHEYIFHLTPSRYYFHDAQAIAEPVSGGAHRRKRADGSTNGVTPKSRPDRSDGIKANEAYHAATGDLTATRNKRSVWTVYPQPFKGHHFATMPLDIAETCIAASTSEKGCCPKCGSPWERQTEATTQYLSGSGRSGNEPEGKHGDSVNGGNLALRKGPTRVVQTIGWRATCSCDCRDGDGVPLVVPAVVLDPFGGAGTTGLAAARMQRDSILVEINPDYAELARERIAADVPLFHTVDLVAKGGAA